MAPPNLPRLKFIQSESREEKRKTQNPTHQKHTETHSVRDSEAKREQVQQWRNLKLNTIANSGTNIHSI